MTYQRALLGYDLTDPDWITANQQGRLAPGQQSLLRKHRNNSCFLNLAFLFLAPSFLGVCFFCCWGSAALFVPKQNQGGPPSLFFLLALALLVPTVLLGMLVSALIKAQKARFQRYVDSVVIERAQGEIVWNDQQASYQAHTPNFALQAPGDGLLPAPGPYHFYYVAGEYLLVSAQPIHTFTQALALPGTLAATGLPGDEQARLALQFALCNALDFSPADLDENRLGRLSQRPRQRVSLGAHAAALWNSQLQTIEEHLVVRQEGGDEDVVFYCDVGQEHFLIPEQAFRALVPANGTRCRVYYLTPPNTLVSVEVLEVPGR